jgi:hypothetical protein
MGDPVTETPETDRLIRAAAEAIHGSPAYGPASIRKGKAAAVAVLSVLERHAQAYVDDTKQALQDVPEGSGTFHVVHGQLAAYYGLVEHYRWLAVSIEKGEQT